MSNKLLSSTKAATGPAGPWQNDLMIAALPKVSNIDEKKPMQNIFHLKTATYFQYHITPSNKIMKLSNPEDVKLRVNASNPMCS